MASALQGAQRPHDAAEALRAFLRLKPDAAEAGSIPARIRALEEAQRLLDVERVIHDPAPALVAVPTEQPSPHRWTRRKTLITTLATVGAVLVVGGVATGLALGLHDWHASSTLGTHAVTP